MQDSPWYAFTDRVTYEDDLHAGCEALAAPMGEQQWAAMRERNLGVLGTLAVSGERRGDAVDDESPLAQELLRLDSKMNVLLAMLEQLLRRDAALPPRRAIRFNAVGALLPRDLWPQGATEGLLRLHFDGCLALPLELPARVMLTSPQERDVDHVFVAFESLDEVTLDAIERLVFRHHRRKVAGRRLTAP
jgi:hypothetical protein